MIEKLKIEPGDQLVVTVPGRLTADEYCALQDHIHNFSPGTPLLILMDGAKLQVLSDDFRTHHDAWVNACTIARDNSDDKDYWQHELNVLARLRR